MRSLVNTVGVIAGASRGIGAALAVALAREGCDVALLARSADGLAQTASAVEQAGRQACICVTDLAERQEIQQTVARIQARFGGVDLLYNGVAGTLEEDVYSADQEEIGHFIQSTLTGAIWLTQALLPLMRPPAQIVNIITDWAQPNMAGPSTFVAGKSGLLGFGQALSQEVRGQGIRVTNLLPGDVASDLSLDQSLHSVRERYGNRKIALSEVVEVILLTFRLESATVDHLLLTPLDPS